MGWGPQFLLNQVKVFVGEFQIAECLMVKIFSQPTKRVWSENSTRGRWRFKFYSTKHKSLEEEFDFLKLRVKISIQPKSSKKYLYTNLLLDRKLIWLDVNPFKWNICLIRLYIKALRNDSPYHLMRKTKTKKQIWSECYFYKAICVNSS